MPAADTLNELSLESFIGLLEASGGRAVQLSPTLGRTAPLPPLKLRPESHDLVEQADDIGFAAREAGADTQVIPEVLFTAPSVVVLDTGLTVVKDSVTASLWRNRKFIDKARIVAEAAVGVGGSSERPLLLLGPIEFRNYSHWILEALPKLRLYRALFGHDPDEVVVVHKAGFQAESLAVLAPGTRLVQPAGFPARCWNAAFTTSLARSISHANPSVFRFYDEAFGPLEGRAARRVYVSRSKAEHRRILNEPDLFEALRRFGFEMLVLEELSFQAQADAFRHAEIVVSPHGAGLANLVFCADCRLVVEIFSSGFRESSAFAHICRHKGVPYLAASGAPAALDPGVKGPWTKAENRSFNVDVGRFVRGFALTLRRLELTEGAA